MVIEILCSYLSLMVPDPFEEGFEQVLNAIECQSVDSTVSLVFKLAREDTMIIDQLFMVILFELFVNLRSQFFKI